MKFLFIHIVLWLFPLLFFAQDATEEKIQGAHAFSKEELQKERDFLQFESHFIDAVKQRNIENYDKALTALAVCEKIDSSNVAMLFEKAKNLYVLKQYMDATYYCHKALEREPDKYWILDLLKAIYLKQRNYPEAIVIQKRMYALKPTAAEGLLQLYYYIKSMEEGRRLLLEIDQKNIYISSVDFYQKFFNPKSQNKTIVDVKPPVENKSIAALQRDFSKNKDFKILQELLEKEKMAKDYSALLKDSKTGLNLFPAQAKIYWYQGLALSKMQENKKAIQILESGLDFIFDDTTMLKHFYNLLIDLYQMEQNQTKVRQYKELVQKLPTT